MNPLLARLAALRRRLRLVATLRGVCWLLAVPLGAACLAGTLDWWRPLPGPARALALVGVLAAAGAVAYRLLVRPLRAPADALTLALRIEALYPSLHDSLASAVAFLGQPSAAEHFGSAELRRETVREATYRTGQLDFHRAVSTRGLGPAGLALVGTLAAAAGLVFLYPAWARTALERLAYPFGARDWPLQTRLRVDAPARVARGQPFVARVTVEGVVPDEAAVEFDGLSPAHLVCGVRRGDGVGAGTAVVRHERTDRTFRFQVRANDAASAWQEVVVVPPPLLVPLEGRPSPQVALRYPAYTRLPPRALPDGTGGVEAVAGTLVTFRAAADRPLARAWVEFRPEAPAVRPAAALAHLAAPFPAALPAAALAHAVCRGLPARLSGGGRVVDVAFVPPVRGAYALRFEDADGVGNERLFDLRVFPDPAPAVQLERPSRSLDSLEVMPGAEVTVQLLAEDSRFGLRSAWLECRRTGDPAVGRLPLARHDAAAPPAGRPRVQVVRRFPLAGLLPPGNREPREGDVLILQACADDFDDLSLGKDAGRSPEVELHVVGRATLQASLNQAEARVQQELSRLLRLQREALNPVVAAEQQWRNTGRLRDRDLEQLLQAEQLQQQVRARLGTEQDGLRAEVGRILRAVRDNRLHGGGTDERMEPVAAELDRLARHELGQVESLLTQARKGQQAGGRATPPPAPGETGPLGGARQHQEEVEKTLTELLKLLEPWSDLHEVRGEGRDLLQEQGRLADEVKKLDRPATLGKPRAELEPADQAALDRSAEAQAKLQERTARLLEKAERLARARQGADPAAAESLNNAARQARDAGVPDHMKAARDATRANRLTDAAADQQHALEGLSQALRQLEDRPEEEMDRLRKKLAEAEDRVARLGRRQSELRKKAREAAEVKDPLQRKQALKRLAREQDRLRHEAQEVIRELTRLRSAQARQELTDAAAEMAQAGRQMDQAEAPDDAQREALDRINEARRQVRRERQAVEEALAREKLGKLADQVKGLKERQEAALAERDRLQQRAVRAHNWNRDMRSSLNRLADAQAALGQEAERVASGPLAGAAACARLMTKSAAAMTRAAERLARQFEQAQDQPMEVSADAETSQLQQEAVRRLAQLMEALRPEKSASRGGSPAGGGASGAGGRPGQGGAIPPLAQLKALRLLQQDVTERTQALAKRHPRPEKITPDVRRQLDDLHKEQQEVAQLLEDLTNPAVPEKTHK